MSTTRSSITYTYQVDEQREPGLIAEYAALAASFSRGQGQNSLDWRDQVIARLKDDSALHGRERIASTLNDQLPALR